MSMAIFLRKLCRYFLKNYLKYLDKFEFCYLWAALSRKDDFNGNWPLLHNVWLRQCPFEIQNMFNFCRDDSGQGIVFISVTRSMCQVIPRDTGAYVPQFIFFMYKFDESKFLISEVRLFTNLVIIFKKHFKPAKLSNYEGVLLKSSA